MSGKGCCMPAKVSGGRVTCRGAEPAIERPAHDTAQHRARGAVQARPRRRAGCSAAQAPGVPAAQTQAMLARLPSGQP